MIPDNNNPLYPFVYDKEIYIYNSSNLIERIDFYFEENKIFQHEFIYNINGSVEIKRFNLNIGYNSLLVDFILNSDSIFTDQNWLIYIDSNFIGILYYPEKENDIYIESLSSVLLTQDQSCKDLNLNGSQDIARISTGEHSLSVNGKLRTYTGIYPGITDGGATGTGIAGWISGTIKFIGSENRTIIDISEFSANARNAGWILEFSFSNNARGYIKNTIRCGHLIVDSGFLDSQSVLDGLATTTEIRVAGDDYTANNGITSGTVLVKSGSTYRFSSARKNSGTTAGNGVLSFILESGAFLIPSKTAGVTIDAISYSLDGTVKLNIDGAQEFIRSNSVSGCSVINTYGSVSLESSGSKSLVVNTIINNRLSFSGTATLNKGAFTMSYGLEASIEILSSKIIGSELPDSGSGVSICKDLILADGVVYDLNGLNVNIRGVLILGAGASVINGVLNENQL